MSEQTTKLRQDYETVALISTVLDRWQDMQLWSTGALEQIRTLAAVRPESVVKAEALREIAGWLWTVGVSDHALGAIRERADRYDPPASPRPAEPAGLGAIVRDKDGHLWVRVGVQWRQPDNGWFGPWQTLHGPLVVLSEGVTA